MIYRFFTGLILLLLGILLIASANKLGAMSAYFIVGGILSFFVSVYFFSTMDRVKDQEIAGFKPVLSEDDWKEIKRRIKDIRYENDYLFVRLAFFVKILRPSDHFLDLDLSLDEIRKMEDIEKIAYAKFKTERSFGMSHYYKRSNKRFWINVWTELRDSGEYELLIESMAKMKLLTAESIMINEHGILFLYSYE